MPLLLQRIGFKDLIEITFRRSQKISHVHPLLPVHTHPERIPIHVPSLDKLAVRDSAKIPQMLRLRGVAREGPPRKADNENCQKREEAVMHLPLPSPVSPLASTEISVWSPFYRDAWPEDSS